MTVVMWWFRILGDHIGVLIICYSTDYTGGLLFSQTPLLICCRILYVFRLQALPRLPFAHLPGHPPKCRPVEERRVDAENAVASRGSS